MTQMTYRVLTLRRSLLGLLTLCMLWGALAVPGAQAEPKASGRAQAGVVAAGKVNINTASEKELTLLPKIGPAKAQAIVKLRTQLKGFKRIEDLMRVRGIGRKTFRQLRPFLTLRGPTTLSSRPAKS